MMISEFIERTGFEPTAKEYAEIENEYYEFDGDKNEFCKAFLKNGGRERICRERAAEIERMEQQARETEKKHRQEIEALKAELESERAARRTPAATEYQIADALEVVNDALYAIEDRIAPAADPNGDLRTIARAALYNYYRTARAMLNKRYPDSELIARYNLREA